MLETESGGAAHPQAMRLAMLKAVRLKLLRLGSATKAELSRSAGISFPTVGKLLDRMVKDGEAKVVGLDESSGGRRALRYAMNPEHVLGLAVFLERDETVFAVFDCLGEVKERGRRASVLDEGPDALAELVREIVQAHPKIGATAIGVPGAVNGGRAFHIPDYEKFRDVDLAALFEERLSMPAVVENDMNAAVIGYRDRSGGTAGPSVVYLYLGKNGPGAGLLVNGDVVRGSTFFSGEVSFVPLDRDRSFERALDEEGGPGRGRDPLPPGAVEAIARLVASLAAILNPGEVVFNREEASGETLAAIAAKGAEYVPAEHLPRLVASDWTQDYLFGLQRLALDRLMAKEH